MGYSWNDRVHQGALRLPAGNGRTYIWAVCPRKVTERLVSGSPGQLHKADRGPEAEALGTNHFLLRKGLSVLAGFHCVPWPNAG